MNKRKTLTIVVIVIILVITIFWVVARVVNNKKNSNSPVSSQPKNSNNMFDVKNNNNAKIIETAGSVKVIAEKTMTITTAQGDVAVGISGSTPVMLSVDKNIQPKVGQIADVRLNDSVDVRYDQDTKEANLIVITQKASDKNINATKAMVPVKK